MSDLELYHEAYYKVYLQSNHQAQSRKIAEGIWKHFQPESAVDMGCNVANDLMWLKKLGTKDVLGIDNSPYAQKYSQIEEFELWDLRKRYPFKKRYSVCLCFDFAEHLEPEYEEITLDNITSASDLILFSSPWPIGDIRHYNEHPNEYWILKMAERNYWWDMIKTLECKLDMYGGRSWVVSNLLVFKRG